VTSSLPPAKVASGFASISRCAAFASSITFTERAAADDSIAAFQVSAFDVESGVVPGTVHVTCDQAIGALPAGTNLAAGHTLDPEGAVLTIPLPASLAFAQGATCTFRADDSAGHRIDIVRTYAPIAPRCGLFCDGFEPGSTALWQ
jgi:hypothetical protein